MPAGGPGGLEVEAAGEAVDVQHFAGEIKSGTDAAFHRREIHLAQVHAAAGDEFLLVHALAGHGEFRRRDLRGEHT